MVEIDKNHLFESEYSPERREPCADKASTVRGVFNIAVMLLVFVLSCVLLGGCRMADGTGSGNSSGSGDSGVGGDTAPDSISVYVIGGDGIVYRGDRAELPDGRVCIDGELKPVWQDIAKATGLVLREASGIDDADVIVAGVDELCSLAMSGALVDLSHLYASLPNLRGYTWENSDARLAFVSGEYGETYVAPLPNFAKNPTRLPYIRRDVVERLLDGEGDFTLTGTDEVAKGRVAPFMTFNENYDVKIISKSHFATTSITKNVMRAGNIAEMLNVATEEGSLSGEDAVRMLRDYIDEAYGGFYGTKRSRLFIGESCAWDADELVALLRCTSACARALGIESGGFYTTDEGADAVRLASLLYGVRGLDASDTMCYADTEGNLVDARADLEVYKALTRIRDLSREGLISGKGGVMCYLDAEGAYNLDGDFVPMVPPVLRFSLADEELICRYSESYYSYDGISIAISASIALDHEKILRASRLVDYLYCDEGLRLASYGSTEGDNIEAYEALAEALTGGNLIEFMRKYLGAGVVFGISDEIFASVIDGYKTTREAIKLLKLQGNILTPSSMPDVEYASIPISPTHRFTDAEYALMGEQCPKFMLSGELYGDNMRRYILWRMMSAEGNSIPLPYLEGEDVYLDVMENVFARYKKFYRVIFE